MVELAGLEPTTSWVRSSGGATPWASRGSTIARDYRRFRVVADDQGAIVGVGMLPVWYPRVPRHARSCSAQVSPSQARAIERTALAFSRADRAEDLTLT